MKDLQIPGDGSPIDNINHMNAIADDITPDYEYSRDLSDEELDNERLEFAAQSIEIERLQEELKRVTDEIKARLKIKQVLAKTSLRLIRTGRIDVRETVYTVMDQNEGMVGTYNQNGQLLSERKMKGTERQKTIYAPDRLSYQKEGTNN